MKRLLLLLAAFGLLVVTRPVSAEDDARKPKPKSIDVVICLDVSNSMDGLIASAKTKLWDIVNDLAKIKPAPNLRVGLYSYGNDNYDAKIGWIRKEVDLTTDLDQISQKLFALTTQGGTEYVTRVCRDALQQQAWADDADALKLIFVCGNEPASQDKVVKLKDAADLAKNKGVIINPIFCGNAEEPDARDWKEYASLCGGRFININQDKSAVAIATPMDKELSELSTQLNSTYVRYGKQAEAKAANQSAQDVNALRGGGSAGASRAVSKASSLYRNSDWDLVDRLKEDPKFDVKKIPVDELCEELKKMTAEEREAHIKTMLTKREAIQQKVVQLNAKREDYLKDQQKKNPSQSDKLFDEAIRGTLRDQARSRGIDIPN